MNENSHLTQPDVLIIGQGLAGTTLAWHLRWLGQSVVVLADPSAHCASEVAAGLVTPVTGQALRARPDFANLAAECRATYRRVENKIGADLWTERAAWRLFDDERTWRRARERFDDPAPAMTPAGNVPPCLLGVIGAAVMPSAARLDVDRYVTASRAALQRAHMYMVASVEPADLRVDATAVELPNLNLRARHIVWCRGAADHDNAWLPEDALNPAKGEMLEVRLPALRVDRVIHRAGNWLRPLGDSVWQFGATYDHASQSANATEAARDALTARLTAWLDAPIEVIGQRAGVRPVATDRQAFVHRHPVHHRVHALNGLGSHGVLTVPTLAKRLAATLAASAQTPCA